MHLCFLIGGIAYSRVFCVIVNLSVGMSSHVGVTNALLYRCVYPRFLEPETGEKLVMLGVF